MTDKNILIYASISLFLCTFITTPAHADFLNFSKMKQEKEKKSLWSALPAAPLTSKKDTDSLIKDQTLSKDEIEQRKKENAALSAKTGVDVPELFDQKLLSSSGPGPSNSEEIKTMRAIKMSKNAQALKSMREANAKKQALQNSAKARQNSQSKNIYLSPKNKNAKQQRTNTLFQFKKKNTGVFKNY